MSYELFILAGIWTILEYDIKLVKQCVVCPLNYWGRVTHICISKLTIIGSDNCWGWFRQWLVAWFASSHYLNQCWNIVNSKFRNKFQWNVKPISYIFFQWNTFENVVCEMAASLPQSQFVNPALSNAAYMWRWNGSSFVSILACHLVDAKSLSEPILIFHQSHSTDRLQWKNI